MRGNGKGRRREWFFLRSGEMKKEREKGDFTWGKRFGFSESTEKVPWEQQ